MATPACGGLPLDAAALKNVLAHYRAASTGIDVAPSTHSSVLHALAHRKSDAYAAFRYDHTRDALAIGTADGLLLLPSDAVPYFVFLAALTATARSGRYGVTAAATVLAEAVFTGGPSGRGFGGVGSPAVTIMLRDRAPSLPALLAALPDARAIALRVCTEAQLAAWCPLRWAQLALDGPVPLRMLQYLPGSSGPSVIAVLRKVDWLRVLDH